MTCPELTLLTTPDLDEITRVGLGLFAKDFGHVARKLGRRKIAFLCTRESLGADRLSPGLKTLFGGALIANEGFTLETASLEIAEGRADALAFGQLFIANTDLPQRFATGAPLNAPNPATFYASGSLWR